MERDINAEVTTDPEVVWSRWADVSKDGNAQAFALFGPRHAVEKKMVTEANRVIDTYRNSDRQPVYENDWKRARLYLARALELEPASDTVRGEMRLCEGQIDRINGISHRNAALLNEAVQKLEDAQRLLPHSPDPELALAHVYIYGLKDIERANSAFEEAERRGYKLGNREKAQLADGYRDRGDRLWWDSRDVRGLPQREGSDPQSRRRLPARAGVVSEHCSVWEREREHCARAGQFERDWVPADGDWQRFVQSIAAIFPWANAEPAQIRPVPTEVVYPLSTFCQLDA